MKAISLITPILFLTACHINDPRPEIHRAKVNIVGNTICVTLPDTKNENISLLSIDEIGKSNSEVVKQFTIENAPQLYADKCLPNFGFSFEPGRLYVFSINTLRIKDNHTAVNGNSYGVTFSVWVDKGQLNVKDIN